VSSVLFFSEVLTSITVYYWKVIGNFKYSRMQNAMKLGICNDLMYVVKTELWFSISVCVKIMLKTQVSNFGAGQNKAVPSLDSACAKSSWSQCNRHKDKQSSRRPLFIRCTRKPLASKRATCNMWHVSKPLVWMSNRVYYIVV